MISMLVISNFCFSDHSNYSLTIGEEDKDRLLVLNEIYNPFTEEFLKRCSVAYGDKVLEIGCGIGIVSQKLASLVGPDGFVIATDINDEQLAIARSLLSQSTLSNLIFQQLSAYELETLNEKFDVVYVRLLLCHLPNPQEIISQASRILKPGGRLLIEDLTGNHTLYSTPHDQGIAILQHFDKLQFEIQQSDDRYFSKLPVLLAEAGLEINSLERRQPKLDSQRKRKMLSYGLSSLKNALLDAGKITKDEYDSMYPIVQKLEENIDIEIYFYELGQICATKSI